MERRNVTSGTSVVLLKVPRLLSEHLEALPSGSRVGTVELGDPAEILQGKVQLVVDAALGPANLPREYTLRRMERKTGTYIFAQRGSTTTIDGVVTDEGYVRPEITPQYLRYKKERDEQERAEGKRGVKAVDSLREGIRIERNGGVSEYDILARRRKRMLLEKKRERLAKTEVMDILFRAFEEYPYWTVKDLADRSGQPQAYIQELLPEIAVINKKTHRSMYELKPEYRRDG